MALRVVLAVVAVGLAWRGVAGGDGCPGSDHYLQPDTREAVEKAQVVLYGRDITPKQSCSSPPELCPRRQIHFEVDYVLKNVIGRTIPARITIGRDGEQIDVRCHGTYFSHDSRQQLVVMVRWSNGLWLWDEIVPKFNAAFTGSPELLDWFAGVCGIGPIHAPSGGSPNHCSRLRKPMNKECQTVCPRDWARIDDKCAWVGTKPVSRDLAERTCVAMGGTLISFLYASTWFALVARLPRSPAASWWTSGVCDPTSDNCKWMSLDGTRIDMSRWKSSSSPKDGAVVVDSSGWWTGNYNDLHNILCEMYPDPALEIRLHGSAVGLSNVCCRQPQLSEKTIKIRKHSRGAMVSAHVMSGLPEVTIKMANATGQKDTLYTLLLADASSAEHAFVYWLVVNIPMTSQGVDVMRGNTWLEYMGPKPNTLEGRNITFIVYRQKNLITEKRAAILDLVSTDGCSPALRCDFHLGLFATLSKIDRITSLLLTVTVDALAVNDLVHKYRFRSGPVCRSVWPTTKTINNWAVCSPPEMLLSSAASRRHICTIAVVFVAMVMKVIWA